MKFDKTLIAAFVVALVLQSYPAHAGFWSTFFGNVASDAVKGSGKAAHGETIDPLLKEKKVQGALAMMGYFHEKGDGDLNSCEESIFYRYEKLL